MQILISNEQKEIRLNKKRIEAVAGRISKILRLPSKSSLSITFFSKAKIKGLNRRYFKRDRATDVIAFGYSGKEKTKWYKNYLGDIIICPQVALENSKLYNSDFFSEISLCIIHGLLHLLGYDDTKKDARLKMQKKEKAILTNIYK